MLQPLNASSQKADSPPQSDDGFEHGQEADSPSGIPALGWWDITRRVFHEILDDRVMLVSAGVTY
jgi:membrane protein